MRKNLLRFLAWLLLAAGLAGGPVGAKLGYALSSQLLRWLTSVGTSCMILSCFWFPRRASPDRGVGVGDQAPVARPKKARQARKSEPSRSNHGAKSSRSRKVSLRGESK